MITDFYLRGSDPTELDKALEAAGLIDDESRPASDLVCLDRIGTISRVTGYEDGEPVIEETEGHHANVRLLFKPSDELTEALLPVMILPPDTPYRVWA